TAPDFPELVDEGLTMRLRSFVFNSLGKFLNILLARVEEFAL
ncbi:MAG: hypothetical protein JWP55_2350, partial [Mycobacterium sp.]|nr:hypothetical protein [Mycobacterium sp.]